MVVNQVFPECILVASLHPCNVDFWIENPPPPFGTFPKIHPFWWHHPSLSKTKLAMTCPELQFANFAQKWPTTTISQKDLSRRWMRNPHSLLWDRSRYQIGWIFGKVPNNSWPPPLRIVPISGNHAHAFHSIWPSYLLAYMQPHLS